MRHAFIWRKKVPGKEGWRCKGPVAGMVKRVGETVSSMVGAE